MYCFSRMKFRKKWKLRIARVMVASRIWRNWTGRWISLIFCVMTSFTGRMDLVLVQSRWRARTPFIFASSRCGVLRISEIKKLKGRRMQKEVILLLGVQVAFFCTSLMERKIIKIWKIMMKIAIFWKMLKNWAKKEVFWALIGNINIYTKMFTSTSIKRKTKSKIVRKYCKNRKVQRAFINIKM